jgi:GNAT superfamily N-acetyltransferase
MASWTIGRLSSFKGDRRLFVCGDPALDQFFHDFSGQYERRRLGVTWVACAQGDERPAGYYTSAASSVPFEAVPIKLPRHPIPTILIARLAVDLNYRSQKLGKTLLLHALRNAREVAKETAVWGVTVDAYDTAVPFYARYGFRPFIDPSHALPRTRTLFLPMKDIEKMPL